MDFGEKIIWGICAVALLTFAVLGGTALIIAAAVN